MGESYQVSGAGQWFPSDPRALRTEVEGYLDHAGIPSMDAMLLGGIAPHAGLGYSGRVAGHTYAALRADAHQHGNPARVVVLGFSHRPAMPGLALLDAETIGTPLGQVRVDQLGVNAMQRFVPSARLDSDAHRGEHSVENQLPFLQCALPGVPVIAGLVCGHDQAWVTSIGAALQALHAQDRTVCIASTDLLHDSSYEKVSETDAQTLSMVEKLDSDGLNRAWSPTRQVCCGIGPVVSVLQFVRSAGGSRGIRLFYENSGDVDPSGRGHWVVGYGSVVFPAPEK